MKKYLLLLIATSFCLSFPSYKAKADPALTLGIIGTALGGTALGMNMLSMGGINSSYRVNPYSYTPAYSMGGTADLLQALQHTGYPATCPSYYGWYSPFGHIGFPCPTCHNYTGRN